MLVKNEILKIEDQTFGGVIDFKWDITCQTCCRRKIRFDGTRNVIVIDVSGYDPNRFGTVEYGIAVQNAADIEAYEKSETTFYIPHEDLFETRGVIKKGKIVILVNAVYELPAKCKQLNARPECPVETVKKDIQLKVFELVEGSDNTFDVELVVDGQKIKAHKGFLSMISPVFNAMFTHNTKEAQTGIIEINDFPYPAVKAAIDMLYGHSVEEYSVGRAIYLLRFAEKYMIKVAVKRLEAWLIDLITSKDFARIVQHAWDHSSDNLKAACARYYYKNLEIGSRSDFKQLDDNVLKELASLAANRVSWEFSKLRL